jgi:hypothetical protein
MRAYRGRLGRGLKSRYGKQDTYTPGQVRRTAYETGCPTDDLCIAYAMYCSRDDFDSHHADIGVQCDYDSMRAEVGSVLFDGNSDFSVSDCLDTHSGLFGIDFGSHHGAGWGDAGGGDSGGHDGGGGSDGGGDGGGGDGGGH